MKKLSFLFGFFIAFIVFSNTPAANAQVYYDVHIGNYTSGTHVFYCTCDTIRVIPPSGTSSILWHSNPGDPFFIHGDTLFLLYGYNANLGCIANGVPIDILLHPATPLTTPILTQTDTICGLETITLDAENVNIFGGSTYLWNTGETTQTITVGGGFYAVTVTNACGSVNASKTVVNYNPLKPNLGNDTVVCKGTTVVLTPGTGYSDYLWMAPSSDFPYFTPVGSDSAISVTYDLATPFWGYNSGPLFINTTNPGTGCQDRDTIIITFLLPPGHDICYVECDTATQKNNVIWSTPPASTSSVNIYREVSTNVWDLIGNVPALQTHFIDTTSNPQNMSYSYKISVVDTCYNEGDRSGNHKTITLLSAYDQPTNTYGFTWSAYVGLVVSNYLIYGLNADGDATQIASVPGNTFFYNYTNPSPAYVKYFVAFISPSCSNKTDYLVKSNLVNSVPLSINELQPSLVNLYPNPVNEKLFINGDYKKLEIFNNNGLLMNTFHNVFEIDMSAYSEAVYFVRIITEKAVYTKKVLMQ